MALEPVVLIIVIILQNFIISRPVAEISAQLVDRDDSQAAKGLARAVSTVTVMSLIMTAVGVLLSGTSVSQALFQFLSIWPVNFCVAFFCQWLVATPLSIGALKALRRL